MSIEHITVTGVEAREAKNGNTFYMVAYKEGGKKKLFSFDPKVSAEINSSLGKTIAVDVDRTPNAQNEVFPKIESFHGEAVGAAPAAPTSPSTPSETVATAAQPARGGGDFKKDPVGIILGSRQTALNAAVAFVAPHDGGSVEDRGQMVLDFAREFNEFLLAGLSPFIVKDGIHVKNVMPWKVDARAAENAAARAQLPPPPPPEPPAQQEIGPGGRPDDDIPF